MNIALPVLTLLCGFLLGVVTGPWLSKHLASSVAEPELPLPPPVIQAETALTPTAPVDTPAEPEMQLKGVFLVGDGTRSVALIKSGDWQPQPYRVDQKLPNGYVVKSIDRNSAEVEKDGQRMTLTLIRASSDLEPDPGATESTLAPIETEPTEAVATETSAATEVEAEAASPVTEGEN